MNRVLLTQSRILLFSTVAQRTCFLGTPIFVASLLLFFTLLRSALPVYTVACQSHYDRCRGTSHLFCSDRSYLYDQLPLSIVFIFRVDVVFRYVEPTIE